MEGIFFILVFIGVIAITALLFGVWVFVSIVRVIMRIIGGAVAPSPRSTPAVRALPSVACSNQQCHAMNPSYARFCRRCGQTIDAGRAARRVACW